MTIEQRLEQLEKRNKRLTVALTMTVVAMCAAVTMAATTVRDVSNSEIGRWEFHRDIKVPNGIHYLLDTATGEIWNIDRKDKKPVTR